MKKIQLREVLDEYDEKTSWTYQFGFSPPETINELHKICDEDLARLKDEDDIPKKMVKHIDEIASHFNEEWTEAAADTLREIEDIIHKNA